MNILITGGNGQLGKTFQDVSKLYSFFGNTFYFSDINETETCFKLDITNQKEIDECLEKYKIDTIINCAAYTNVDKAENDYDTAYLINSQAPQLLAASAKAKKCLLIHISTDYVFGTEHYNTPCNEEMKGTPLGVYGMTKKRGEDNIINSGCKYLIFRTSWLYSKYGNNFLKTMLKLMDTKDEIKVVNDQVGTPTYANDLATTICYILEHTKIDENIYGVYNYSNEGVISWYDFAYFIKLLTQKKCRILPCKSSEYPSIVQRPSYSVLDKTKIKNTFGYCLIPYWVESLSKCIGEIKYDI